MKIINVDINELKDRNGNIYNQYNCLVADETGCFYFAFPDFVLKNKDDKDFLKTDAIIAIRNGKCYKERSNGLSKITIDRWGKVTHEEEIVFEAVNTEDNFSIPKP